MASRSFVGMSRSVYEARSIREASEGPMSRSVHSGVPLSRIRTLSRSRSSPRAAGVAETPRRALKTARMRSVGVGGKRTGRTRSFNEAAYYPVANALVALDPHLYALVVNVPHAAAVTCSCCFVCPDFASNFNSLFTIEVSRNVNFHNFSERESLLRK